MLIWLILTPAIAAALIGLVRLPGRPVAVLSALISLVLTLCVITCNQCSSECMSTFMGRDLQLTLDLPLSRIMILLTAIVTLVATIGLRAPNADAGRSWSISTLLISCGATGAFLSDNIIAFYGFHELALIPTFVMIGLYGRGDRRTISWMATLYLGAASMVLLAGILILCAEMGAWTFSGIATMVSQGVLPTSACAIGGLLLLGFGALVSLFPFHSWAAPAYASAPTPVAMMHAGVLKKFGLYGLFTIAAIFGPACQEIFGCWNNWLLLCLLGNVLWVGFVTMTRGR